MVKQQLSVTLLGITFFFYWDGLILVPKQHRNGTYEDFFKVLAFMALHE